MELEEESEKLGLIERSHRKTFRKSQEKYHIDNDNLDSNRAYNVIESPSPFFTPD